MGHPILEAGARYAITCIPHQNISQLNLPRMHNFRPFYQCHDLFELLKSSRLRELIVFRHTIPSGKQYRLLPVTITLFLYAPTMSNTMRCGFFLGGDL